MAQSSKAAKASKPRLGRGLSSLMSEPVEVAPQRAPIESRVKPPAGTNRQAEPAPGSQTDEDGGGDLRRLPLERIVPSRHQPRQTFSDSSLQELAESIRASGLMQPIAVRPLADAGDAPAGASWELVAGERRWRAAKLAGLDAIPAMVVSLSDADSAAWALVENLQREDLNPVETGQALRALQREHGLTHGEIAQRLGLHRSTVANFIRLTELPAEARALVSQGALSTGHAKALLSAPERLRDALAKQAAAQGWSVRRLEGAIRARRAEPDATPAQGGARDDQASHGAPTAAQADLEKRLGEHLGTRVRVQTRAGGKRGRLVLEFYDLDHFDSLLTSIGFRSRA